MQFAEQLGSYNIQVNNVS